MHLTYAFIGHHLYSLRFCFSRSCDPNCETQKWNVRGETRVGIFGEGDTVPREAFVKHVQKDIMEASD